MILNIALPNESILSCSELKLKQYKELLKATYGDQPSPLNFIEALIDVFSNLTNKERNALKTEFGIYELFLILLNLRLFSLGSTCGIVIQRSETIKANLELNLIKLKEDLQKQCPSKFTILIEFDSHEITLKPPSLSRILQSSLTKDEEYLSILYKINFNKQNSVIIKTDEEARTLFENLPPKISIEIVQCYENYIKTILSNNLLERYNITDQRLLFTPNIETLLWFTKLLFNESLNNLYDNMFYLAMKSNISPSYLEECNPGEYMYFVKKLEEWIREQNKQANPNSLTNTGFDVPEDNRFSEFSDSNE
jgi:hypothetical protein